MEGALKPAAMQDANSLCRPFADPVADSARLFRSILTALSHPGRIVPAIGPTDYPESLGPTGFGAALTLLDNDTRVYLSDAVGTEKARSNLRFHCGCPIVDDPAEAAFAILTLAEAHSLLPKLPAGTPDYPDSSATALILVDGFSEADGIRQALIAGLVEVTRQHNVSSLHVNFPTEPEAHTSSMSPTPTARCNSPNSCQQTPAFSTHTEPW